MKWIPNRRVRILSVAPNDAWLGFIKEDKLVGSEWITQDIEQWFSPLFESKTDFFGMEKCFAIGYTMEYVDAEAH